MPLSRPYQSISSVQLPRSESNTYLLSEESLIHLQITGGWANVFFLPVLMFPYSFLPVVLSFSPGVFRVLYCTQHPKICQT